VKTCASILQIPIAEAQLDLTTLAAAGILDETVGSTANDPALVVRPDALRYALIRDVAFGQPGFPWASFLAAIDGPNQTLITLVAARLRGADIPPQALRDLASVAGDDGLEAFCYLGEEECRWVLETAPERIRAVSVPALLNAPESTIPHLLTAAVGDERLPHATPGHPLRLLSDWVRAPSPGTAEVLSRRTSLVDSVAAWIEAGGSPATGGRAFAICLDPSFEFNETDPGAGMTLTMYWGPLGPNEIDALATVWRVALESYGTHGVDWPSAIGAVHRWAHPGLLSNQPIEDDVINALRVGAGRMIGELIPMAEGHPGALTKLAGLAVDVDLTLPVEIPNDFATLFPTENFSQPIEAARERHRIAVEALAASLVSQSPAEVVERLVILEREAAMVGLVWPRLTPLLAQQLSASTTSPVEWVGALLEANAPSDLVWPFVDRAIREGAAGWDDVLSQLMDSEAYRLIASEIALMLLDSDSAFVERAIALVGESPFGAQAVETLAIRSEIPTQTLLALMVSGTTAVRTAAAVGEWLADPSFQVREGVTDPWRAAVLQGHEDDYWVGEILSVREDLALEWLLRRLADEKFTALYLSDHDATRKALSALGRDSRFTLVSSVPASGAIDDLVARLISADSDIYRALLARDDLRGLHLAPLSGHPTDRWPSLVLAASEAGYSPDEIGHAAFGGFMSWSGNESDMWRVWQEEFAAFESHDDDRVREAAAAALEYAAERRRAALAEERDEAIHGISRARSSGAR
jgi:hypothetical protein